jgi:hypothetical protein
MTVASLMKLIVFNSTTRFDPFLLVLDQIFPRILNAHERQSVTTWVIIEYRAFSTSNDPLDVERCENINTLIQIANTLVDVMEAINAHDDIAAMARSAHSYRPVVALIAKIESKRYTANHRTTVVEDALALANPPAPPSTHALALMLEMQKRIETAIMSGATATLALPGNKSQWNQNIESVSSISSVQPTTILPGVLAYPPHANQPTTTSFGATQEQIQQTQQSLELPRLQQQQPTTVTHVLDVRVSQAQPRNSYISPKGNESDTWRSRGEPDRGRYVRARGNQGDEKDERDDVGFQERFRQKRKRR